MKRKNRENNNNLLKKFIKITSLNDENDNIYYFKNKTNHTKKIEIINEIEKINKITFDNIPQLIKLIEKDVSIEYKSIVLKKMKDIETDDSCSSEKSKLNKWIYSFLKIPFQKFNYLPVSFSNPYKCKEFLKESETILNDCIYGMDNVKSQFLQLIGKWIVNSNSNGTVIGLKGPMGVGKTTIIKNGISKILNRPFSFVALGGANDGSYLDGHSYTYEGSTYGKIMDIIIQSNVLNPIIFFDELDKVSQSEKGSEIIGILTHITDNTQNNNFQDKYFSEISIDLSKCLFVFSFNDETLINPILKDRMKVIDVKGYNKKEKIIISKKYLMPELLKEYNFTEKDIYFNDDILEYIIEKTSQEEGVRNLKRNIETIISKINLIRIKSELYESYELTKSNIDDFLELKTEETVNKYNMMYL
jgi:ATP-dependent Lon protease